MKGSATLGAASAVTVSKNCTDRVVQYKGGADFRALLGKMVTLEMRLQSARVYTVGWS